MLCFNRNRMDRRRDPPLPPLDAFYGGWLASCSARATWLRYPSSSLMSVDRTSNCPQTGRGLRSRVYRRPFYHHRTCRDRLRLVGPNPGRRGVLLAGTDRRRSDLGGPGDARCGKVQMSGGFLQRFNFRGVFGAFGLVLGTACCPGRAPLDSLRRFWPSSQFSRKSPRAFFLSFFSLSAIACRSWWRAVPPRPSER